ncbi:MAG: hypothetical protein R3F35_14480 [Myxococcota bacterium]
MAQPTSVSVPIEHCRRVHEIEPEVVVDPDAITLRELVETVAEFSASEQEVVAAVMHMLRSGRVKLHGAYEEPPAAKLCG